MRMSSDAWATKQPETALAGRDEQDHRFGSDPAGDFASDTEPGRFDMSEEDTSQAAALLSYDEEQDSEPMVPTRLQRKCTADQLLVACHV